MQSRKHLVVLLATVFACASGAALADAPVASPPPAPADRDVTMTVIPSGVDVVKTVVQNISVPANAKVAKAKSEQSSKGTAGQDSKAAEQNAQQLAEAAAEHQAGQTQSQVQQQALQAQIADSKVRNPPSPPPPPPRPPR